MFDIHPAKLRQEVVLSQAQKSNAFYSSVKRDRETRWHSYIFHMRNFNNWVKATLITLTEPKKKNDHPRKMDVLDLACGKGGDLLKWSLR